MWRYAGTGDLLGWSIGDHDPFPIRQDLCGDLAGNACAKRSLCPVVPWEWLGSWAFYSRGDATGWASASGY